VECDGDLTPVPTGIRGTQDNCGASLGVPARHRFGCNAHLSQTQALQPGQSAVAAVHMEKTGGL